MNNNRGNIIIIEGPQGVGKSTMANFLRDNLASSNLYRLTGIKDKSQTDVYKRQHIKWTSRKKLLRKYKQIKTLVHN